MARRCEKAQARLGGEAWRRVEELIRNAWNPELVGG